MAGIVRKITEENIWIYRTIVIAMLGILGFIGSWMFAGIVSLPSTYVTVQAAEKRHDELKIELGKRDLEFCRQLDRIASRLDSIQDHLMQKGGLPK